MTETPEDQLARAVRDRRRERGMSQDAVAAAGGPSDQTVRRIESGAGGPYRAGTLAQLDKALEWKRGTAKAILEGTAGDNPAAWVMEQAAEAQTAHVHGIATTGVVGTARLTAPPPMRPGSFFRVVEDAAPATDTVTAGVTPAAPGGDTDEPEAPQRWIYRNPDTGDELHGAVYPPTDNLSLITRAGLDFIDLAKQHRGDDPATTTVKHAVLSYIQHLLAEATKDHR